MKFLEFPRAKNATENAPHVLTIRIIALNVGNIEWEITVTAVLDILTMASIMIVNYAIFNAAPV
jgi:hypothetical protein